MFEETLTQGNLLLAQSVLEICSIELAEGGDYTCNATNGVVSEANTTTLTVVDNRGKGACIRCVFGGYIHTRWITWLYAGVYPSLWLCYSSGIEQPFLPS